MTDKVKTGILFGSFNPPHNGHLQQVHHMRTQFSLKKVWMLPIEVSPFKPRHEQISFEHKVKLCRILAEPHRDWLKVSTAGKHFTGGYHNYFPAFVSILQKMQRRDQDSPLYILGGDDFSARYRMISLSIAAAALITKQAGIVGSYFELQAVMTMTERFQDLYNHIRQFPVLSNARFATMSEQGDVASLSSTQIRSILASEENTQAPLGLPDEALTYIREKRLYRAPS